MDAASAHITSLDQLDAMLANGHISEEDYAVLRQAVVRPPSNRIPAQESARRPRWGKSWKNRQVGGVCGGIAEAMEIDAWTLRLVFVAAMLFTGGSAILVYILLYFVLPWKEDEEHLVWRFPAGLAIALLVLWPTYLMILGSQISSLSRILNSRGQQIPAAISWLIQTQDRLLTMNGIIIQTGVLLVVLFLYMLSPPDGKVRKIITWAVCGVLIIPIVTILGAYWSEIGRNL
ncbi:MAG: PspC domain-containing protein [Candidatus Hydrogenedentes bacterium]|nr:PspC domain-containing protein [Candidatus Hydrogenedentota bacterium]